MLTVKHEGQFTLTIQSKYLTAVDEGKKINRDL